MNVYKPLMIANIAQSITMLTDGCTNFRKFLVEGTRAEPKEDYRIRPPLTDAGYGTRSGDRLRQGFGDRPSRSGE